MELYYQNTPKFLFRKYSKLVTLFARTQLGRDYLRIPNEYKNIGLLTPNSFHIFDGRQVYASFCIHDIYTEKLIHALLRVDIVSQYIVGIDDTLKVLAYQLGLIRNPYLTPNVFLDTTGDINVTADGCGNAYNDAEASWALARDAATAESVGTGDGLNLYGGTTGGTYYCARIYTPFDTSSIAADAVSIDSADFKIYVHTAYDGALTVHLGQSNQASATALAAADFNNWTGLSGSITSGGSVSAATSGSKTIALNPTALGWVVKAGNTLIGIVSSNDQSNTTPTTWDRSGFYKTTVPPTLNVVYTSVVLQDILGVGIIPFAR